MRGYLVVSCFCLTMTMARLAPAQAPSEFPQQDHERTSLVTAYLLSVGATAAPMGIAAFAGEGGADDYLLGAVGYAGLILGPSAGHWYAGRRLSTGLILRAGSMAFIAGLAVHDPKLDNVVTVAGLIGALGVFSVGQIWDLVTLPAAVRRHNREKRASSLHLAPLMNKKTDVTGQGRVTGLALSGAF